MKRFGLLLCFAASIAMGCGRAPTAPTSSPSVSASSPSPEVTTSTSPTPSPSFDGKLIAITYRDGVVTPKLHDVEVALGQTVRIEIGSDRQEELHVHGYDKKVVVAAGQTAVLEFTADIPGKFEVELEKGKVTLFELVVR